jgi:Sigma-70 region 2
MHVRWRVYRGTPECRSRSPARGVFNVTKSVPAPRHKGPLVPETNIDFAAEISTGFAASYIRRKARELSRQTSPWLQDVQDLQQELTLQVLQNQQNFDPTQGCFNAYVKLVVDRDAANFKRDLLRQVEERASECSLSSLVSGEDGVLEPLGHTISEDEKDKQRGQTTRPWQEKIDLEHDIARVVHRLPCRLKNISRWLMDHSPSQVARRVGLSRTTLYELIKRIRMRFAAAGLGPKLKKSLNTSRLSWEVIPIEGQRATPRDAAPQTTTARLRSAHAKCRSRRSRKRRSA